MIEIKEMKPYALKAGDLVFLKNENAKLYRVLAPADANGTIQLHLIDGSPVDVYNVHVSRIKMMMMTSDFVKPVHVVFD